MNGDKSLNDLLKWSIENSEASGPAPAEARGSLNPEALKALFGGGPSDADLMKAAMEVIHDPATDLDNKLVAFDNFEQLIENLDNANNMEPLALWSPLLKCLAHDEHGVRKMAAWCVGTAVQNNVKSQERLLVMGGIPPLVHLATQPDEHPDVRRKAVYALSSGVRNYQPAMDLFAGELEKKGKLADTTVDATNMDAVDEVINMLRKEAAQVA